MLDGFWKTVGESLAKEWVAKVFAPAFVFWAGGLVALIWRFGWTPVETWWFGLRPGAQITVLVAGLIGIAVSAAVVQRFGDPCLRLLEGYWPGSLGWLRQRMVERQNHKLDEAKTTSLTLLQKGLPNLTADEEDAFVRADSRLRHAPHNGKQRMPTTLGNILRASERRPRDRYGLETLVCWPRLWVLLPEQAREDVSATRAGLDAAIRVFIWGLLFALWTGVAWWAAPIGVFVALYAYRWSLTQAETYGDLLEAAFDLYRFALYEALRWPLPKDSSDEKIEGERLSQYLHRGFTQRSVFFKHPEDKRAT